MPDYLRTYLLEQIAAWALARAVAAEDAAARLAADRAVLIAQRDALARKLAEAERRARRAGAAPEQPGPSCASALSLPAGLRWHGDHHGGWEVRDTREEEVGYVERRSRTAWTWADRGGRCRGVEADEASACLLLARALRAHYHAAPDEAEAPAALPPSVLPIRLEEPTYRHAVRVALPGWIDRLELSVKL